MLLEDAIEKGNQEVSIRQSHSIKSASANIGAERVRAVAEEMEKKGKAGDLEVLKELFPLLRSEFDRVEENLKS